MRTEEWTLRATTAGLRKMPDPIIPPITIMVASKGPMRRASAALPGRGATFASIPSSLSPVTGTTVANPSPGIVIEDLADYPRRPFLLPEAHP